MKKISTLKKLNASTFALVVALAAGSYSNAYSCVCESYVGLDVVYNFMKFKKDFGENIFAKNAPGLNVFVGHTFHEHFGVELGFEVEKKKKRTETIPSGQIVNGVAVLATAGSYSYNTKVTQRHPYLGAVGKINITDNSFVSLLAGVSLSHVKAESNMFRIGANTAANITRTFSKTKVIPILRATVGYKFNNNFGLRALASWKNTARFKLSPEQGGVDQVKLKDSINFGVGAIFYI